jgi:hypothetical protein
MARVPRLNLPAGNAPIPAGVPSYLPGGVIEGLPYELFDYVTYAAAGQQNLTFFQTPPGQAGKTEQDTNVPGAGLVPAGQQFTARFLAVDFVSGATPIERGAVAAGADVLRDILAVRNSGILTLEIGTKEYVSNGPLSVFPNPRRFDGSVAISDASTAAADLVGNLIAGDFTGPLWHLGDKNLDPQVPFKVTIAWPAGVVALPSGVAGRIGVRLIGWLRRKPQ